MTLYMPLFRACVTLKTLNSLHAHLVVTGLHKDPLASTKLIETYSQMGSVHSARLIFDSFPCPDSFMWGMLIKCHVWNGLFQEAIFLYKNMLESVSELNEFIFPPVLRACPAICDLFAGETIHTKILKSGFDSDPVIQTSLMNMYGEMRSLCSARKIFDGMTRRDTVSWSSIISSYLTNDQPGEGLEMFRKMVSEGVEIDFVTMLSVVEACGELGLWQVGKSAHGYLMRRNIGSDHEAFGSSLLAMYGKFGDIFSAKRLLYSSACHSVSSWTAMISGYNQNGYYSEALETFSEMIESNVDANSVTLMTAVCSSARLGWLREGKSIHGYVIRKNIDHDRDFLRSSLIDLYSNCGKLRYGRRLFDATEEKHVVSWNILISGYVREQMADEALSLFIYMLIQEIMPDSYALASALSACGIIGRSESGCQIHCFVIKTTLPNEFVHNALIDMYSKCGLINSAFRVFQEAQQGDIVAWNSMICGFSQNGYSREALDLFDEMYANNLEMDEVTFLCALKACSNLGFVCKGKWIHHKLITFGVAKDVYIETTLTNMYAQCGDLLMARTVFDNMKDRTIVSWSAMIGAYATHGSIDDSISLFDKMVESGIKPNDVVFMNILSGCSHAGYVEKGKYYFNSMVKEFGITPNSEHYACLVDLLSRSGNLNEAYKVINSMPFHADASIWGSLVNGCRIHQRMDFLNIMKRDLIDMCADDSGYYTLLSNACAEEGKWNEFMMIKSKMRSTGLKKVHGYSMIEID